MTTRRGVRGASPTPRSLRLASRGLVLAGWMLCGILAPMAPVLAQSPSILAPPTSVMVADTPNDRGGSLTIHWSPSPTDLNADPAFRGYTVRRSREPSGPFEEVAHSPRSTSEIIDSDGIQDGARYYYVVVSVSEAAEAASDVVGPAISSAQWFHKGRVNALIAVLVLSRLIIYFIEQARRGKPLFIRKIAGLDAVDEAVGRATEMGRKILYIPGTQDMDQVQTLAGISILGRVARMTAQYDAQLDVPVSRSLVMVACRETVKESYISEGRPDAYSDEMVYYVTDDQFGYAAAMDGLMVRERPATIFMLGLFYAESLVLAETGNSIGAIQIAGTAEPSQLPFFVAACDYTLIGEELFVAGAYLSREPRQLGSLKGQDMGKALILLLLLVGIILQTTGVMDFASLFKVE